MMCFKVFFLMVSMLASHFLSSKADCIPNSGQLNIADVADAAVDEYDVVERASSLQEAGTSENAQQNMSRSQAFVKSFTEGLKKVINSGPSHKASLARDSKEINDEMNKIGSISQSAQKEVRDSEVDMAVAAMIQQENIPDEAVPQSMISSAATSSVIKESELDLQKFKYNITATIHEQIGAIHKMQNTFNVKLEHKAGRTKPQQLSRLSNERINKCMENAKKNLYTVGVKEWQIKEKIAESLESTLLTGLPSDVKQHEGAIRQYLEKIRHQAFTEKNAWLSLTRQFIDIASEYLAWKGLFQEKNITHPELRSLFQEGDLQGCSYNFYYKDTYPMDHAHLIFQADKCRTVIGALKNQGVYYGLEVKKIHIIQSLYNIQKEHTQRFEREQVNLKNASSKIVELGAERVSVMGFSVSANQLFENNLNDALIKARAQQAEENEKDKQLSEFREKAEVSAAARAHAEAEAAEALRISKADQQAKVEAQKLAAKAKGEAGEAEKIAKNTKMKSASNHYKLIIDLYAKCSALHQLYRYNGMGDLYFDDQLKSCDDIIRQGSSAEGQQSPILADKLAAQLTGKERTLLEKKPVHPWVQLMFEIEALDDLELRFYDLTRLPNEDNHAHLALFASMIEVKRKETRATIDTNKNAYIAMYEKQACLMMRHRLTKYCIQKELNNFQHHGRPEGFRLERLCDNSDIKCLDGDYEWFDYLPSGYISEANIDKAMMNIKNWDCALKRPMNYKPLFTDVDVVEDSMRDTIFHDSNFRNPLFVGAHYDPRDNRLLPFYKDDIYKFIDEVGNVSDKYRSNQQGFFNHQLGFPENGTNHWLYPDPLKDHLNVHSVKVTSSALKRMLVTTTQVLAFDLVMEGYYTTAAHKAKTVYYQYGGIKKFKEKFIGNIYEEKDSEFKCDGMLNDADSIRKTIALLEKHNTFEEMQSAIAAVLQEQPSEEARKRLLEKFWVTEAEALRAALSSLNVFIDKQLEKTNQPSQNDIDIRAFELLNRDLIAFLSSREASINNYLRSLRRQFSLEDALVRDILVATEHWRKLPSDLVDVPLNDREERALDYYVKEYLKSRESSSAPVAGTTSYMDVDSKGNREQCTMHVSPSLQLSTSSVASGSCSNDSGWFCKRNLIIAGVAVCVIGVGVGVFWVGGPAAACEGTVTACKGLFSWFTKKAAAKALEIGAELAAEEVIAAATAAAL